MTKATFLVPSSRKIPLRLTVTCLLTLLFQGMSSAAFAEDPLDRNVTLNIRSNTLLEDALIQWGTEVGMTVMIDTSTVSGRATKTVLEGQINARKALDIILRDSGLSYTEDGTRIQIVRSGTLRRTSANSAHDDRLAAVSDWSDTGSGATASADDQSGGQHQGDQASSSLETVLVSAEKRTERLQDVPVPVTAVSADSLLVSNQVRLQDYFTSVPGLSLSSDGARNGFPTLFIRGLSTGPGTNPTVGITVDDVPYGSSTLLGGGDWVPDVDPNDLARVEVLRGPQGTLYGANSLGGLVKYVTVDPSTDAFSGRVEAGADSVYNGTQAGFDFRGAVNAPLGDTVAVRASLFARRDPGYIDNPKTHVDGVNLEDVDGGRLSALWRPSEAWSLKLGALFQRDKAYGSPNVGIGLGDLEQTDLPRSGGFDRKAEVFSANLAGKFGGVDLVSVTGYSINTISNSIDYTYALGIYTAKYLGINQDPGTEVLEHNKTTKFTEEIRLSGTATQMLDWLVGAYFSHEKSPYTQDIAAVDSANAVQTGSWGTLAFPTTYQELAGFTDLTVHFTDRFDVQFGGRESYIKQGASESNVGTLYDTFFLGAPSPVIYPEIDTTADAFTYLVTPRFKVSSDFMVYARLASGYRAGGVNVSPGDPRSYSPDKTQNYELGIKGDLLPRTVSVDASVYRIDWKDIQLGLVDPNGNGYISNATRARSQGIELALQANPIDRLSVASWVAWNDAKLTEGFPSASTAVGDPGDRLPYGSRFSGNVSLDDEFPLVGGMNGVVGGTVSYVGSRVGPFPSAYAPTTERQVFPGYAKTDLHAGLKYGSWTTNFFVNNVTDRRATLSGGIAALNPTVFTYIQPRTAGLSVAKTF